MKKMKISLITATFNSANTISETIDSVRQQNFENLEYIIIDGASSDGTLEILKQHNDLISKLISQPDSGIYDALNKGLKNVSGDIVGFLHSDDILADNNILAEINNLFETKNIDLLYGDLQYITNDLPPKIIRYWRSGDFSPPLLKKGWMPPHPTVYFKRDLIEKIGLFNTSFKISADYDWIVRSLTNPEIKVEYLPKVLVKMKTGGVSNRNLKKIFQKSYEDYKIIKQNKIGNFNTLILKNFSKINQFFGNK